MTPQEVYEFWVFFRLYVSQGQRKGQAMMNALHAVAPELYDDISGTRYDIFYIESSQAVYRFREYLGI